MSDHKIIASSVTKSIQLLAAWLVGLLALNASFLSAAAVIKEPAWAAGFLVICAAANVPVFLGCLFLLQTKFRPEMQEDSYYARYLEGRVSIETGQVEIIEKQRPTDHALKSAGTKTGREGPSTLNLVQLGSDVRVNDLLVKFPEIVKRLTSAGIKVEETFGSSSQEPDIPPFTLVSIRDLVPVKDAQAVLQILDGLIDKVGLATSPSPHEKTIYVGSYGYQFGIASHDYDDMLKNKLLRSDISHDEFIRLLQDGS